MTLPEPSHGVAKPNGGTGGLLPIIDVAVTGIGRAVQILAGLFCDLLAALAAGHGRAGDPRGRRSGPIASGTGSRLGTGDLMGTVHGHGLSDAAQMDARRRAPRSRDQLRG